MPNRHPHAADLGVGLYQMRLEAGWSQRDLVDRCLAVGRALSHSQVSKIERGECYPRPGTLSALARTFGIENGNVRRFIEETVSAAARRREYERAASLNTPGAD